MEAVLNLNQGFIDLNQTDELETNGGCPFFPIGVSFANAHRVEAMVADPIGTAQQVVATAGAVAGIAFFIPGGQKLAGVAGAIAGVGGWALHNFVESTH